MYNGVQCVMIAQPVALSSRTAIAGVAALNPTCPRAFPPLAAPSRGIVNNIIYGKRYWTRGRGAVASFEMADASLVVRGQGATGSAVRKAVWALDFDGVICDSAYEMAQSAWKAATILWPAQFVTTLAAEHREGVIADLCSVRPVVEAGFEFILLARCLLEGERPKKLMENWPETISSLMAQWNVERSQLVNLLANTRDNWIATDLRGWTGANRLYSAIGPALGALVKQQEAFIVTTKQAQYVDVLLRELAGVRLAPERIVSTAETGEPKATVLGHLQAQFPDTRYHFVEDRAATLESVASMPQMEQWKLHLADWGYNTPEEREACRARPDCRIEVLSRRQLFKAFVRV